MSGPTINSNTPANTSSVNESAPVNHIDKGASSVQNTSNPVSSAESAPAQSASTANSAPAGATNEASSLLDQVRSALSEVSSSSNTSGSTLPSTSSTPSSSSNPVNESRQNMINEIQQLTQETKSSVPGAEKQEIAPETQRFIEECQQDIDLGRQSYEDLAQRQDAKRSALENKQQEAQLLDKERLLFDLSKQYKSKSSQLQEQSTAYKKAINMSEKMERMAKKFQDMRSMRERAKSNDLKSLEGRQYGAKNQVPAKGKPLSKSPVGEFKVKIGPDGKPITPNKAQVSTQKGEAVPQQKGAENQSSKKGTKTTTSKPVAVDKKSTNAKGNDLSKEAKEKSKRAPTDKPTEKEVKKAEETVLQSEGAKVARERLGKYKDNQAKRLNTVEEAKKSLKESQKELGDLPAEAMIHGAKSLMERSEQKYREAHLDALNSLVKGSAECYAGLVSMNDTETNEATETQQKVANDPDVTSRLRQLISKKQETFVSDFEGASVLAYLRFSNRDSAARYQRCEQDLRA